MRLAAIHSLIRSFGRSLVSSFLPSSPLAPPASYFWAYRAQSALKAKTDLNTKLQISLGMRRQEAISHSAELFTRTKDPGIMKLATNTLSYMCLISFVTTIETSRAEQLADNVVIHRLISHRRDSRC